MDAPAGGRTTGLVTDVAGGGKGAGGRNEGNKGNW